MLASALLLLVVPQDPGNRVSGDKDLGNKNHTAVKPASKEAELAHSKIAPAQGLVVSPFAAEPMLANPVAFTIDERGRVFVAETYRVKKGVLDMRDHRSWVDDDLASRTVEQRVAQIKSHVKDWRSWSAWHEQIRLVEDRNGDGKADSSSIFADGFNDVASGIGAGLLARAGTLYYTCIPDLWRLTETSDGSAPSRAALSTGYGVHNAFFGHDLHGLRIGPDRKLYFSIGDRGLHVVTQDGVLDNPDSGAVLRCELDGSELEIYATGLRNPQELAFDDHGNLFTGDNNGDGGDKARLVYVVAGGDSGWRIGPQWIDDRGPWNRERLWHLAHKDQPAWIVPPLAHICNGPSGFTHYPGTGLQDRYADSFFLVDFTGTPSQSGVYALRLQPSGASFELAHLERFAWGVLATDCEFGPDGGLWVLDWVESWEGSGKGRIWRVLSPEAQKGDLVAETRDLLRASLANRPLAELQGLLGHRDQRVRMEAHFALADRGKEALEPLAKVASDQDRGIARLHAIWGLMLAARAEPLAGSGQACRELLKLLEDPEFEVRAQAAKALGERRFAAAAEKLRAKLRDTSLRVRMFAAEALGRIGDREATEALCQALSENADRDPFLRHAMSLALSRCADRDALVARIGAESSATRMGVLLALRHQRAPEIAQFLGDPEARLVVEAARAIHDLPIDEAMPQLAAFVARPGITDRALSDRAINAALRLGTARELTALLGLAGQKGAPEGVRVEALWAVEHFEKPGRRDRVLGDVRPLPARDLGPMRKSITVVLEGLVEAGPDAVAEAAIRASGTLGLTGLGKKLTGLARDPRKAARLRTAALDVLDAARHDGFDKTLRGLTTDSEPAVRALVLEKLGKRDPAGTVPMLETALRVGTLRERQRAYATLAKIEAPAADALLLAELDRAVSGRAEPELELDLVEAIGKRKDRALGESLAAWQKQRDPADPVAMMREALRGGSREAGDKIFKTKTESQCTKCHRIGGEGPVAGPDLKGVGKRLSREKILEALLVPSKVITEGFGTVAVELKDSRVIKGVLKAESASALELVDESGVKTTIQTADIETRADPVSAMTPMGSVLSRRELRDLVEFLASLDE